MMTTIVLASLTAQAIWLSPECSSGTYTLQNGVLQCAPSPLPTPPATCSTRLAKAAREYVDAAWVEPVPLDLMALAGCTPQFINAVACCGPDGCGGCPESPADKIARLKCELRKVEEGVVADKKARDLEARRAEALRKLKAVVDICVPKAKP